MWENAQKNKKHKKSIYQLTGICFSSRLKLLVLQMLNAG